MLKLILLFVCLQLWINVESKTIEVNVETDSGGCGHKECCKSCRPRHVTDGHIYDDKYFISDFKTTWYRARDYCEDRRGMSLLSVGDRVLSSTVIDAIKESGSCSGKKFWTDEKKYARNLRRNICLYIEYYHREEEYIFGSCERKRYFICERL